MSHELVYGLRIEADKVMINSVSNNVSPREPHWQEYSYFTKLLKEKGIGSVNLQLLRSYEEGNLQPGIKNKYSHAIVRLHKMPEYSALDWRTNGPTGEYAKRDIYRKEHEEELNKLLLLAFNSKYPKDKFIIKKEYFGREVFGRVSKRCVKWVVEKERATIYRYQQDAIDLRRCYTNSEEWQVVSY